MSDCDYIPIEDIQETAVGLDQYLTGRKFLQSYRIPVPRMEDGFEVEEITVKLGYWRKHPNLHGYIVQNYGSLPRDADGDEVEGERLDDCRDIELSIEHIHDIINAIKEDELPFTEGFFFGKSYTRDDGEPYEQQKDEDLRLFSRAIAWLTTFEDEACWRSVSYKASW
jgi:hypothetical protein